VSQWLYSALAERACSDLRRDAAHEGVLKAQLNKTDRNDARGMRR